MGILPAGMYRNRTFAQAHVDAGETELCRQDLLYDPQTAGGLLMAVDPADADALYEELRTCVPSAQRIGIVREYQGGKRIFLQLKKERTFPASNKKTWNLLVKSRFSE